MQQLNNLMQKEMSRKEFIATLGLGVASILGFSSILKLLFGKGQESQNARTGYGSSPYGGNARRG